jgi:hypothetical protein
MSSSVDPDGSNNLPAERASFRVSSAGSAVATLM